MPGVKEAKVRFECRLEHSVELGGDDTTPGTDLIIGRIVQVHIDEKIYENGRIDPIGLGAEAALQARIMLKLARFFRLKDLNEL